MLRFGCNHNPLFDSVFGSVFPYLSPKSFYHILCGDATDRAFFTLYNIQNLQNGWMSAGYGAMQSPQKHTQNPGSLPGERAVLYALMQENCIFATRKAAAFIFLFCGTGRVRRHWPGETPGLCFKMYKKLPVLSLEILQIPHNS